MFQQILDDLKAQFGSKVQLSPEDIAEIINVSVGEQANKRSQGRFPIPYTKDGGRIRISIYALAKYLADCCNSDCRAQIKLLPPDTSRTAKKSNRGHLQHVWWSLRSKPIISIIRCSILDMELNNRNEIKKTIRHKI
jgi:hypothetical protein